MIRKFPQLEAQQPSLRWRAFESPFAAAAGDWGSLLEEIFAPREAFVVPPENPGLRLDDSPLGDPRRGLSMAEILAEVEQRVVRHAVNTRHPAALAHMTPPAATVSVLADMIIGALNQCAFIWEQAPVAKELESEVIRWLARRIGLGERSTGLLTSGGTLSNCLATYLALERVRKEESPALDRLCIVATDQAHISITKAAALVGLPDANLVRVKTDASGRLQPGELNRATERLSALGQRPFLFVCTAGTSNTGTVEPAGEFLEQARRHRAWCHVDAAHGGLLVLSREPRPETAAWREADSISWDPHKSLYVSYSIGALLLREKATRDPLRFHCEYALKKGEERDPGELHLEGSRRLEALKLWMTIKYFGLEGFAELTDHCLDLARELASRLAEDRDFELLNRPDTNVVCFRLRNPFKNPHGEPDGELETEALDRLQEDVQRHLYHRGGPLFSSTRLGGRAALRAVLLNPMAEREEIPGLIEELRQAAQRLHPQGDNVVAWRGPREPSPAGAPRATRLTEPRIIEK